jgi:uncharacterized protein
MFFHIRDLEVKPIRFDTSYAAGEIDFLDPGLRQSGPLAVRGVAELLSSVEEIRVRGSLLVNLAVDCDRCLEPAAIRVEQDFDLYYRPEQTMPEGEEVGLKEGESEIAFYSGEALDLKEILREQILLALPQQRLCRSDCQGMCPVCGQNRNLLQCSCVTEPADDRWQALRNL